MQPLSTELILIRVTGEDRPGLTASVTEILAKYDATILDIGQADIHNTLSLGILCKTEEQHSGFIMKELLFKASSLGVTIRFYPISVKEYEDWVNMQGKNRYILTLLGLDNMYRRMRRLICFDMDSTLIETEVIDELAIRAGVGNEVKAITERAMRGEIDFTESFRERVALLKGLDESVMQEIAENLPITEGVDRLMYVLKKYGYKIAILSGGFTYFGQYLQKKYGIDYVYANELEIVDGKLTGRYLGDVVDGKRKAELLRLIAQVEKVDIAQTIAVGDGANDLPMLGVAGLGIAFHAKPKVVANAKQSINTIGLDGVLYFLGFKDSYIDLPK
jgi:phosphoserine phosphatase SerB